MSWSGLRDGKPKREKESGVGGDRAPSDLVFVKLRGRKIEGTERAQLLSVFLFFFFISSALFYSSSRYKDRMKR